jgi:hypothetical protein
MGQQHNITLHYWVWLCVLKMPLGKYVDSHPRGVRNVRYMRL